MAHQNTAEAVQLRAAIVIYNWIQRLTGASNYFCASCVVDAIENIQPQQWYNISDSEAHATIHRDRLNRHGKQI